MKLGAKTMTLLQQVYYVCINQITKNPNDWIKYFHSASIKQWIADSHKKCRFYSYGTVSYPSDNHINVIKLYFVKMFT